MKILVVDDEEDIREMLGVGTGSRLGRKSLNKWRNEIEN